MQHKSYTGRKNFIENQPKIGEMNPNFQQTENRLNINGSIDENILRFDIKEKLIQKCVYQ